MPSRAKTLIDSLRKTAIGLGIKSSLSKERDLCARLLFGRPYASVIPAEAAGSLGAPSISQSHAAALVERHGASGQLLLHAAMGIVEQEAAHSSRGIQVKRDHQSTHRLHQQASEERSKKQHPEVNPMELKPVSIDIDFVACKGSGILSDTLFERIQADGLLAGYAVSANFVDRGGDSTNPIARIRVSGTSKAETTRVLDHISALAKDAFSKLTGQADADRNKVDDATSSQIGNTFQHSAIKRWRKIDATTYTFALKGIPTNIRLVLKPSRGQRKGFDFRLSHVIHTPVQIGPYFPSNPWGDDVGYALHQAVTSLTMFYDIAVERGFSPDSDWLVPNDA